MNVTIETAAPRVPGRPSIQPWCIYGIYERSYNDTGNILRELRVIKASIDSGSIPAIKDCWRINKKYLELELFGMYSSQVFFEIK
ncbi:MAG: hypothetical protein GTO45_16375 [Candidatus Aminicenantes bacterium]|nr:hypothetical protein [Candidatus Aminicenantes bacterium]NIM78277.1 hypothetical protein [Candidatus Aminicenantes bacterium]NIN19703.1 hypothetical protein [Candidatus Aminicenantes bacterium]NIN43585.1 hypothetical protein [Candidatus Aminicenantes bacterium]NIN86330.1 hypothetical protein [Candidatus Aminicenantes bacterium]